MDKLYQEELISHDMLDRLSLLVYTEQQKARLLLSDLVRRADDWHSKFSLVLRQTGYGELAERLCITVQSQEVQASRRI